MSYLEELLPKFRKGAKIRSSMWSKKAYIHLKDGKILDESGLPYTIQAIAFHINDWELYQEPIDWDYIIDHKCLCWFWDDDRDVYVLGTLSKISDVVDRFEDFKYKWHINGKYWKNCRPCRRDEVTFYENKNNE